MPRTSKTDEFSEESPLIFGKLYCNFFNWLRSLQKLPFSWSNSPVQRSKFCNTNFWIENDPSHSEFFRKFIRFGGAGHLFSTTTVILRFFSNVGLNILWVFPNLKVKKAQQIQAILFPLFASFTVSRKHWKYLSLK